MTEGRGPHELPRPLTTSLEQVVPWLWAWPLKLPGVNVSDT